MLTRKQYELLVYVKRHLDTHGVSPSFDEMKDALALRSKSGIHRLITGLEERGFIRRLPHRARALEVVKLPENHLAAIHGADPARVPPAAPSPGSFQPNVIRGDFRQNLAGAVAAANAAEFKTFASDFAIYQQPLAGFHNEILTSSVRSGIWGLIAAVGFFAGPVALSLRTLRADPSRDERLVALGLLVFSLHLLVVSLGTEVNNLVFLASFNGLTLAMGMGYLLRAKH